MLPFAELSYIASRVAVYAGPGLRDDVYQEAWLKFLRWPPPNRAYAWRAAKSARDSLWLRERRWWWLRDEGPEERRRQYIAQLRSRERPRMAEDERKRRGSEQKKRWYHANLDEARARTRERVRQHRRNAVTLQGAGLCAAGGKP